MQSGYTDNFAVDKLEIDPPHIPHYQRPRTIDDHDVLRPNTSYLLWLRQTTVECHGFHWGLDLAVHEFGLGLYCVSLLREL